MRPTLLHDEIGHMPLIDRAARDKAADLADAFWNGVITNFQLEERWPGSPDRGVRAVEEWLWAYYDDFREHRIGPPDRSDPATSNCLMRCVEFLRTDEPYEWPHGVYAPTPEPTWLVYATFGLVGLWNKHVRGQQEEYWRDMKAHGDIDAWPFRRLPNKDVSATAD